MSLIHLIHFIIELGWLRMDWLQFNKLTVVADWNRLNQTYVSLIWRISIQEFGMPDNLNSIIPQAIRQIQNSLIQIHWNSNFGFELKFIWLISWILKAEWRNYFIQYSFLASQFGLINCCLLEWIHSLRQNILNSVKPINSTKWKPEFIHS